MRCWPCCPSRRHTGRRRTNSGPGPRTIPGFPTLRQVLGYDPGDKVTNHAGLVRYMEALVGRRAGADEGLRVRRELGGPEADLRRDRQRGQHPQARRDQERHPAHRRSAQDPEAEARKLIAALPAVVWLSYGVHGNEISSPDAALQTAYHLLAARNDKIVDDVLAKVVVLIDPTQNPDGRDRFVNYYEQARGLAPDASPVAAEHNEPWPGGRVNHYLFDLNRDWIGLTQPEIREPGQGAARVAPAGVRGPARDERREHLFLHAGIRPVQSQPDAESAAEPDAVRQEQRKVVRQIRLRLLHARSSTTPSTRATARVGRSTTARWR